MVGRMAEQSLLTDDEPNSLIEISTKYTPISFISRINSFNTDLKSVPPTTAASNVTDFQDERQLTSPLYVQENRS